MAKYALVLAVGVAALVGYVLQGLMADEVDIEYLRKSEQELDAIAPKHLDAETGSCGDDSISVKFSLLLGASAK